MIAQLTATIVNLVRKKGVKPVNPEELMPRVDRGDAEIDWETLKTKMRMMPQAPRKPAPKKPTAKKPAAKEKGGK